MKNKIKVGIIGCGAIGSAIAEYCNDKLYDRIKLSALFDIDRDKAEILKKKLAKDILIAKSLDGLIELSDLIIESASKDIVGPVLKKAIKAKKDVMMMSAGGIIENEDMLDIARRNGCKIYIPSGAICGLDGIKAASTRRIDHVTLTTKKPPQGLKGAPYVVKNNIDLDSIRSETLIFEGSASEAIKGFPQNINVSATLSLAGIGIEDTKVKIICSPGTERNIHEIELNGEFGRLVTRTENLPSPDNPKTSYLAALSAIATLKGIIDNIRIGT